VEKWTVTNSGTLVPGITRHYIRINPATSREGAQGDEDPDSGQLTLANQRPGDRATYPAKEIVDAGFLELVRFGVRKPGDPLIEDSLKVVDAVLKVDTPKGPCWKRYNHDGYGQRSDGTSFQGWGVGRPWPLLTGERATYELAAGRTIDLHLSAIENFTTGIGLIPEQIWDAPDMPTRHLCFGGPTGAANPLMWAHSEYVKLLRSVVDNRVFDLVEPVAQRYRNDDPRPVIEVWKINRQVRRVPAGGLLRVQASSQFVLHWSDDGWKTVNNLPSTPTAVGVEFADIQVTAQAPTVVFTFYWPLDGNWQGVDYHVEVIQAQQPASRSRKAGSSE